MNWLKKLFGKPIKDIRCRDYDDIAMVIYFRDKEQRLYAFKELKRNGLLLEPWNSNRPVSNPFWLVCSNRYQELVYAVTGLGYDGIERPYYNEGVCQQADRVPL
jgi:hypothetical protein